MDAMVIREVVGSIPKVNGRSNVIPTTGPTPGNTPIKVPAKQPKNAARRFGGVKATEKPVSTYCKVSISSLKVLGVTDASAML
jgi:hypothetical protein